MTYKILCLSGGGMRGVFQARLLDELSKDEDIGDFWQNFNLIAGTSVGAIIALGLASGKLEPNKMVKFFEETGPKIFSKKTFAWTSGPFYKNKKLHDELITIFNETELKDCNPTVAIVSTHLENFKVRVFSPLTLESDKHILAVDAIMASTAAPAYFPSWSFIDNDKNQSQAFVDGGIWGNNPTIAAITLASEKESIPFTDMRLLHIGNGEGSLGSTAKKHNNMRPMNMPRYLIDMFFSTQRDICHEVANRLIGEKNVLDIDVPPECPFIELDDVDTALSKLPSCAESVVREQKAVIKSFITS